MQHRRVSTYNNDQLPWRAAYLISPRFLSPWQRCWHPCSIGQLYWVPVLHVWWRKLPRSCCNSVHIAPSGGRRKQITYNKLNNNDSVSPSRGPAHVAAPASASRWVKTLQYSLTLGLKITFHVCFCIYLLHAHQSNINPETSQMTRWTRFSFDTLNRFLVTLSTCGPIPTCSPEKGQMQIKTIKADSFQELYDPPQAWWIN